MPKARIAKADAKATDLFAKCLSFTRADEIKASGYYPYFRAIQENEGPVVRIEGRPIIMAGSNNYLGLTRDPRVKKTAVDAVERYGTGCSGSRYLTGTLYLHNMLEERLAAFFGKESCLLYSTGYQTAQGIIPTLVQKGEYVVSDRDNHACIIAGNLMAKGAFAEFVRYKHNDMEDLEKVLKRLPPAAGKLVVSDGVFSTSGTIVDLPAACCGRPAAQRPDPDRRRPCHRRDREGGLNLQHAAYHVLALVAPFLVGDGRVLIERLGEDYL